MRKYRVSLLLSMFIFGTIGVFRRMIPYDSALVADARAAVGFLTVAAFFLITRKKPDFEKLRRYLLPLCLSGALLGANWVLLFESYRYTSVSVATACYYVAPILMILASPFVDKVKLTLPRVAPVFVAALGMLFVSGMLEESDSGRPLGILFALGASVGYAAVVMINRRLTEVEPAERTGVQLLVAALVLLPYTILSGGFATYDAAFIPNLLLAVTGILHTGVAYLLFFGAAAKLPAVTVAIYSYLDPAVAVLLSVTLLREPLTPLSAVGVACILLAAIASELIPYLSKKKENC